MSNMPVNNEDKSFFDKIIDFVKQSVQATFKYFWSKTLASVVLGLIGYGFLYLIKIEHAGIIGIIIGVFNLVPAAGGLIASIICGIIAVFQSPLSALYVVITILVLQQLDQWVLTPLIVGKSVNLPSIIIILSLIAGSLIWGPVGIILAVPIAGMVRAFYIVFLKSDKKQDEQKTIDINNIDEDDKPES